VKLSRKGLEIAVLSLLLGLGALGSAMFASELWLPFALASAVTGLCAISASINASAFLLPFLLLYTTGVFAAFLKSSGLAQTSSLFGAWFLVCLYSGGVFFIYFLYRLFEAD